MKIKIEVKACGVKSEKAKRWFFFKNFIIKLIKEKTMDGKKNKMNDDIHGDDYQRYQ